MDADVAISLIRMAGADRTLAPWQRPSDAWLVQLGLDALMADIESPSLPLLAGLARNEYGQAPELFDLVLGEMGLLPLASEDLTKARWTAARWWAAQIVAGRLDPIRGARTIWLEAAAELDYPDVLQPIVDLATAIELLSDDLPDQERVGGDVTAAARSFLAAEAHQDHGP
ncbi:hypothetical protein [Streptomyces sp. NPDC050738]|uniref:hypothetical protein n=1 Tax=Streptomyces sp. NPDC050738 TaxID=3154744 RepID=UPI00342A36C7